MISTVCASAAVAVAASPALAVLPPPCERSVAVSDVTATEGTGYAGMFFPYKPFVFTVSSTGCLAVTGTIEFETVNGTANTYDYFAKSGTLSLASGASTATIAVYVWMDGCTGPDDTFWLKLSGGGGSFLSIVRVVDAWGRATIVNDDGPLHGSPSEVLPDPQCVR